MKMTYRNALADIQFVINWQSEVAVHTDCFFGQNVNFWRDIFYPPLYEQLVGKFVGDQAEFAVKPGVMIPYHPRQRFTIQPQQFEARFQGVEHIEPRSGRFYPKGILRDVPNVFSENREPFRCAAENSRISVDFNHPLAEKVLTVASTIQAVRDKPHDKGGSCRDWVEVITTGPGMQARWGKQPTDFFADNPFGREDSQPDALFYQDPRLVNHIDETAMAAIRSLYGQKLPPGAKVLDLMSSWTSHLPDNGQAWEVVGLGLNADELAANQALNGGFRIHDLNENPRLPFADKLFDAIICTVSVEYLTHPFDVFEEAARILKPHGVLMVTFSNRWFPPKVIQIWKELHEFERMGLVLEYFLRSGAYSRLETYSARGLPRPMTDKYYPAQCDADPVYAVWGYKN